MFLTYATTYRAVFSQPRGVQPTAAQRRDVGTTAAARSYFKRILPDAPEPMDQTADGPAVHGPAHGASYGTGDRQPLEADASSE